MLRGIYHLITNPRARAEWRWMVLRKVAVTLIPNYRLQWPQTLWWQDVEFSAFLKRFHEYDGHNADRRWNVRQLTKLAAGVPGDTAECGVLEGSSSYLIASAFPDRTHHAFDSFEGCSQPVAGDGAYFTEGALTCSLKIVQENLKSCPNVRLYKGWIPESFPAIADKRFAFVHIDVQLYQPTRDSLAFFYPRMNKGGIIVCDDYGFTTCPGARRAVDEVISGKPEPIVELSCGSSFIVKC
ncbi:MAG TPA: TylF/MycF/NovP-related O-methyltransferase [Candidatus Angelobacter sp.]|nr:TylF/MycF/NovP-related O-methyltransferase [Candidatus Angelobacter sp.]